MTPQELKASILQLAIQGKLVEQRPEEGTGEELFQKIQAEKQNLIKAGKIKKSKPYPEISDEEIPFDIPDTWVMARLQDIVYNRGQEVPSETFCYIDIGSIDNKRQKLNAEDNIVEANKAPSRARKLVKLGDILYSTVRPYLHNMCIIDRDFSHKPIASTGFAAMTCYEGIYNKYLFYYLLSPVFDSYANDTENAKGVAYPAINDDRLYRAVIAIPPYAEQKRIVAKIEELLPLIDRYEQAWSKLEEFNKRFPVDMQKSILQMAIQGKLVPQLPEEGTGEELFQQIQAEKQHLIKAGKIKKEKPLPEVAEDEIPFDIPENWCWVRLADLVDIYTGKKDANFGSPDGEYNFFTCSNQPIRCRSYSYDGEYLIMPGNGANIGMVIQHTGKFEAYQRTYLLENVYGIFLDYLKYHLEANWKQYNADKMYGSAIPYIKLGNLTNYCVAFPPLAEQKRIVAKLEEILPVCEKLK